MELSVHGTYQTVANSNGSRIDILPFPCTSGSWAMGHQRRRDNETSHELSSFDILGGNPSFPATTTLDASLLHPARSSQPPYAGGLAGEGIPSGAMQRANWNQEFSMPMRRMYSTPCSMGWCSGRSWYQDISSLAPDVRSHSKELYIGRLRYR